ncbi:site-specific DNA-methyltransferase [uncultured Alistipes sp.]|uniref:site-specific DNA-methyltransferase n=1 Tax=uncultured Alistipes sp. TaxID=538949 RepID=UPI002803C0CD|nr:site-specific DNA-methyltransferase [uncultured Alistipes sp.]
MEHLKMQTADMADRNIEQIGALFPECLTERINSNGRVEQAIDFDKLRQLLAHDVVEGPEQRYQFTWPDKRAAIRLANTPTSKTLRPCRAESVDFDTTQNLYIEGDNLDVLKLLRENYLGKVKMIYIDPPYNTGNDFVYNDDFAQGKTEFEQRSGLFDAEGHQTIDPMQRNTEANGRFHTDWLNMIYPRLKVARDLLSDDGVIFISIDDNEVDNLRKICDEIFGEQNRLDRGELIWVNKGSTKGFNKIVKNHEYILAYGKNAVNVKSFFGDNRKDELEGLEHYCYNKPSPKNPICDVIFKKGCRIEGVKDIEFTDHVGDEVQLKIINGNMVFRNGVLQNDVLLRGSYPYKNQIEHYFKNDGTPTYDNKGQKWIEIFFNRNGLPRYRKERNNQIISSVIDEAEIPNYGSDDIATLFGKKEIFSFPKPHQLLLHLISYFADKDAIILDFFSGSATTAHATLKMNALYGGNRKFIMVQLPEKTDPKSEAYKAGYPNICEIGKERIRRAGKKIKEENKDKEAIDRLDTGFRVLKLDSSNMADVYYTPAETPIEQTLGFEAFEDNIKPDRTAEDLLFQVMPECNLPLSSRIEEREIHGKKVYAVDDNYLVACFDRDIDEQVITEIARMQPYYFVMRDASAATDNVLDNFDQIFNAYSKETIRRIL